MLRDARCSRAAMAASHLASPTQDTSMIASISKPFELLRAAPLEEAIVGKKLFKATRSAKLHTHAEDSQEGGDGSIDLSLEPTVSGKSLAAPCIMLSALRI